MTHVIGIDPSLSRAIAVLSPTGDLERLGDLPVIRDGRLAWIDGGRLQSLLIDTLQGRSARAVVERVGAMPRQSVASSSPRLTLPRLDRGRPSLRVLRGSQLLA